MGLVNGGMDPHRKYPTFADLVRDYLAYVCAQVAAGERSERTIKAYEVAVRRLMDRFASWSLDAITVAHACGAVAEIFEAHGPAAGNMSARLGRMVFRFAGRSGWVGANPFTEVPRLRTVNRRFPTTPDHIERIVDICTDCFHGRRKKPLNPVLAGYFPVVALTGMRRSEVTHLRWDEIDWSNKTITIQTHKTSSKTGAKMVHVPGPALEWLRQIQARGWSDTFVFPSKRSRRGHIEEPWKAFKRLCKAADVPGETRLHDLRHGFAVAAYSKSGDLKVVQGLLGHASLATTSKYVGAAPPERARPVADSVAELLLGKGGDR